jgi:hypothetical protein
MALGLLSPKFIPPMNAIDFPEINPGLGLSHISYSETAW